MPTNATPTPSEAAAPSVPASRRRPRMLTARRVPLVAALAAVLAAAGSGLLPHGPDGQRGTSAAAATNSTETTGAPDRGARKRHWRLARHRTLTAADGDKATVLVRARSASTPTKIRMTQRADGRRVAARTIAMTATPGAWRKVRLTLAAVDGTSHIRVWAKHRKDLRITRIRLSSPPAPGEARATTPRTSRSQDERPALPQAPEASSSSSSPSSPSSSSTTSAPAGWRADMSEDFNSIAPSRWQVKDKTYSSNEESYLLARNTSVSNGVLRIQGKKEKVGGRNYTSGYIQTNGKYSVPNYFRAEVRAKVPFEQGMWAAPLWFRPTSGAGEIDLVETYGNERNKPVLHQTIHTDYGSGHKQTSFSKPYSAVSKSSATDWHTYVIEKVRGRITMWVDGVKTSEFTPANTSWYNQYYETGKRWNMRVNLQIGGQWGGSPNSSTDWSGNKSAMQVDYIKTWVPN